MSDYLSSNRPVNLPVDFLDSMKSYSSLFESPSKLFQQPQKFFQQYNQQFNDVHEITKSISLQRTPYNFDEEKYDRVISLFQNQASPPRLPQDTSDQISLPSNYFTNSSVQNEPISIIQPISIESYSTNEPQKHNYREQILTQEDTDIEISQGVNRVLKDSLILLEHKQSPRLSSQQSINRQSVKQIPSQQEYKSQLSFGVVQQPPVKDAQKIQYEDVKILEQPKLSLYQVPIESISYREPSFSPKVMFERNFPEEPTKYPFPPTPQPHPGQPSQHQKQRVFSQLEKQQNLNYPPILIPYMENELKKYRYLGTIVEINFDQAETKRKILDLQDMTLNQYNNGIQIIEFLAKERSILLKQSPLQVELAKEVEQKLGYFRSMKRIVNMSRFLQECQEFILLIDSYIQNLLSLMKQLQHNLIYCQSDLIKNMSGVQYHQYGEIEENLQQNFLKMEKSFEQMRITQIPDQLSETQKLFIGMLKDDPNVEIVQIYGIMGVQAQKDLVFTNQVLKLVESYAIQEDELDNLFTNLVSIFYKDAGIIFKQFDRLLSQISAISQDFKNNYMQLKEYDQFLKTQIESIEIKNENYLSLLSGFQIPFLNHFEENEAKINYIKSSLNKTRDIIIGRMSSLEYNMNKKNLYENLRLFYEPVQNNLKQLSETNQQKLEQIEDIYSLTKEFENIKLIQMKAASFQQQRQFLKEKFLHCKNKTTIQVTIFQLKPKFNLKFFVKDVWKIISEFQNILKNLNQITESNFDPLKNIALKLTDFIDSEQFTCNLLLQSMEQAINTQINGVVFGYQGLINTCYLLQEKIKRFIQNEKQMEDDFFEYKEKSAQLNQEALEMQLYLDSVIESENHQQDQEIKNEKKKFDALLIDLLTDQSETRIKYMSNLSWLEESFNVTRLNRKPDQEANFIDSNLKLNHNNNPFKWNLTQFLIQLKDIEFFIIQNKDQIRNHLQVFNQVINFKKIVASTNQFYLEHYRLHTDNGFNKYDYNFTQKLENYKKEMELNVKINQLFKENKHLQHKLLQLVEIFCQQNHTIWGKYQQVQHFQQMLRPTIKTPLETVEQITTPRNLPSRVSLVQLKKSPIIDYLEEMNLNLEQIGSVLQQCVTKEEFELPEINIKSHIKTSQNYLAQVDEFLKNYPERSPEILPQKIQLIKGKSSFQHYRKALILIENIYITLSGLLTQQSYSMDELLDISQKIHQNILEEDPSGDSRQSEKQFVAFLNSIARKVQSITDPLYKNIVNFFQSYQVFKNKQFEIDIYDGKWKLEMLNFIELQSTYQKYINSVLSHIDEIPCEFLQQRFYDFVVQYQKTFEHFCQTFDIVIIRSLKPHLITLKEERAQNLETSLVNIHQDITNILNDKGTGNQKRTFFKIFAFNNLDQFIKNLKLIQNHLNMFSKLINDQKFSNQRNFNIFLGLNETFLFEGNQFTNFIKQWAKIKDKLEEYIEILEGKSKQKDGAKIVSDLEEIQVVLCKEAYDAYNVLKSVVKQLEKLKSN